MDLHLIGKTALVTGAGSIGLGRAIALGLLRDGATLAITARRGDLLCEQTQEIKHVCGVEPAIIEADLYHPNTPARLAAAARERLGRFAF